MLTLEPHYARLNSMNRQVAQKIAISHGYGVFVEQVADPKTEIPVRIIWEIA